LFAEFDFLFVKTVEVVAARVLDGRMKRRERLHKHLTLDITATGATGDLREQLEGPFARAKIRLMQREIGVNNAHERDIRKMQPFRDHLRADEDIDLARAKIAKDLSIIILALHRVGVHALDPGFWKKFGECFLNFLSACAGKTNRGIFTFFIRADRWNFFNVAADVTGKFLLLSMKREREAAIRALANVAALRALQRSRIAAPVQKKNRLFAAIQPLVNGFFELR